MRWSVRSPNDELCLTVISMPGNASSVWYTVTHAGETLIDPSPLGIVVEGAGEWMRDLTFEEARVHTHREVWNPPWGDREAIPDAYKGMTLHFRSATGAAAPRSLLFEFRVYDEGVGIRYTLPDDGNESGRIVEFVEDLQEFRFPSGCRAYAAYHTEAEYELKPIEEIRPKCQIPLVVEYPSGMYVAVAEAGVFDHSQMLLSPTKDGSAGLRVDLCGPMKLGAGTHPRTPWRVIMVAKTPAELHLNNYLILNLNPPCALADTSWIKPGKVLRDVTLSTRGALACIDFARTHNLDYIMFDAGWYGPERDPNSDATFVSVDPKKERTEPGGLDLHEVIAYGNKHGIGVILYVNRLAMERQLEEIIPLYAKWGVKGVKFGFVRVGSQEAMSLIHRAVRLAAEHRLVVNIHDAYRPTGMSRTYPNLLTQEGVRGNEHMPTARHNATLPFTRYTSGPADATICYYSNRIKTTHAHQLAISVVFLSPLQSVFWYDRPSDYRGEKEIEFFAEVPTVWDETRVIHDAIGEHATIARRSGERWFVGSITNEQARETVIPLSFLPLGKTFVARVYTDCEPGEANRTGVRIDERVVDAAATLRVRLAPHGGAAVLLSPQE